MIDATARTDDTLEVVAEGTAKREYKYRVGKGEAEIKYSYMAWDTRKELDYIESLGNALPEFSQFKHLPYRQKMEILCKGYLRGCERREEWGNIDRDTVVAAAMAKLETILGGAA